MRKKQGEDPGCGARRAPHRAETGAYQLSISRTSPARGPLPDSSGVNSTRWPSRRSSNTAPRTELRWKKCSIPPSSRLNPNPLSISSRAIVPVGITRVLRCAPYATPGHIPRPLRTRSTRRQCRDIATPKPTKSPVFVDRVGSTAMTPAIVLAAGASRRMGRPKALLDAGNRTFIRRILDTLCEAGLPEAVVVVRAGQDEIVAAVEAAGFGRAVLNPRAEE